MNGSQQTDRVGLYEAKTNLSSLVDRVRETRSAVTLTRRGEPVAVLHPVEDDAERRRAARARVFREVAERHAAERAAGAPPVTTEQIRECVQEGRL